MHTNTGAIGYRIKKLEVIAEPGRNMECTFKVYKIPQTTATVDIDFDDQTLLAAAIYTSSSSGESYPDEQHVVFDNEVFNQDIYLTVKKQTNMDIDLNYYIELEQVKLDLNENTVATLKDIRNIKV